MRKLKYIDRLGHTAPPSAPNSLPNLARCRTAGPPFSAAAAWAQGGQNCHILTILFGTRLKEPQLAFEITAFNKFCSCPFIKTWTSADCVSTVTPTLTTAHTTRCGCPSSRNQRKATNGLSGDKGRAGRGGGAMPCLSGWQPSYRGSWRWLLRRARKTRHQHHG